MTVFDPGQGITKGNPIWDYIQSIMLAGQAGTPENVPGANTAPGSDPNNTGTTPNPDGSSAGSNVPPPAATTYPWQSQIKNPAYPFALWGGQDNVDAKKPPDWLTGIVNEALAMPDGPDKTKRIQHILSATTGPDYITEYLHSVFPKGQYW